MNTDRELMQQALDALEVLVEIVVDDLGYDGYQDKTIENLRARLAQPEPPCKTGSQCIGGKCTQCVVDDPEPVAWIRKAADDEELIWWSEKDDDLDEFYRYEPLYTAPPQREWQKITDYEADEYWDEFVSTGCRASFGMGVDYANRVLREKNK